MNLQFTVILYNSEPTQTWVVVAGVEGVPVGVAVRTSGFCSMCFLICSVA